MIYNLSIDTLFYSRRWSVEVVDRISSLNKSSILEIFLSYFYNNV